MENEISKSASILGAKGGKTKGESKRRSSAHYAKLSALGVKARWPGNAHDRRKAKRAQGSGTKPERVHAAKSLGYDVVLTHSKDGNLLVQYRKTAPERPYQLNYK